MSATQCPICLKLIRGKGNMSRHLQSIHLDETDRYHHRRCPLCPFIFLKKYETFLTAHLNREHKEDLSRLHATAENVRYIVNAIVKYY